MKYMKKLVIVLLSFLIFSDSFPQDYIPFDFNNGIWRCYKYRKTVDGADAFELQYYAKGDTLINDTIYQKLYVYGYNLQPIIFVGYVYFNNYVGAIKNQVDQKKVRMIYPSDFQSKIIYDFNLNIGDTIKSSLHGYYNNLVVTSIDSAKYCDKYCKVFKLNGGLNNHDTLSLIESIGFNSGLIDNFPYDGENDSWLRCYYDKTSFNCNNCQIILSKKEIQNEKDVDVNYYNNFINIKSNKKINNIILYDVNGRIISEMIPNKANEYNINYSNLNNKTLILVQIIFSDRIVIKKILK